MADNANAHKTAKGDIARRTGFVLGPLLFALSFVVPLAAPTIGGEVIQPDRALRATLGLALWMACWWASEALPLAATSLLPLVVLPVFGVMPATTVASSYFDDIIALFLGGFCLALAMEKSGLHRRIAFYVMRVFGSRPRGIVFGFLAASTTLSMWVSNTATTLLLLPVAVTVCTTAAGPPKERDTTRRAFAAACVLAVSLGASIGGIGTLIGTPPNIILKAQYDRLAAGPELTFGSWMLIGVPLVLTLTPLAWLVLTRLTLKVPADFPNGTSGAVRIPPPGEPGRAQRASFAQISVTAIFFATALLWITHGNIVIGGAGVPLTGWDSLFRFGRAGSFISDGTIAILAALALFALPSREGRGDRLLTWKFANDRLPWGALLLFGGGFALAAAFSASGLSTWAMALFAHLKDAPPALLLLAVIAGIAMLSEIASNTASALMAMPLLAALAAGTGMPPLALMAAGALGASCGYALPVATPPNTVVYASGEVNVGQMLRAGAVMDLLAIAAMWVAINWLLPLALPG